MFGLFKRASPAKPPGPVLKREQLVPRIKHINFLRAMHAAAVPLAQMPNNAALCGELLVTYAFDLPDRFIMATSDWLEQADVTPAELPQLALANLKRELSPPTFFEKDGCQVAHTGNYLEATLLLVDSVWDDLAATCAGEILVCTPRRDRIVMCDSANPRALATLRRLSAEFFDAQQDEHCLSTQLMVRRGGHWSLSDRHRA